MELEKRLISSEVLFSAVSEQLAEHRQAVFTVTGMSMWPLMCHGRDQVVVEQVGRGGIRKGDIVLFRAAENRYILHRVTKCRPDCFETTGDGNMRRDGFYPYGVILGRVVKIIRPDRVIVCAALRWRFAAALWMATFPMRRGMFGVWFHIRKYLR